MNKLTKTQIKKIKKFALAYYKKIEEPEHGIEHANRTIKLAEYLARKEKANIQIARLGALLHQFHNGSVVEKFLKKIKVDKKITGQLVHCVEAAGRENIPRAKTVEAKVVYDADKLQVVGPFGIIREIACDMAPPRNKDFPEALRHTKKVEKRCFETLQTKTAKKLAKQPHQLVLRFWKVLDKWDKLEL
jgi:HD superfamily phosphodiesterase